MKISQALGVGGVSQYENSKAKRLGHLFEWPMVLLAVWILVAWYLMFLHRLEPELMQLTDWGVWLLFVTETFWISTVVWDRPRYLKENWMNPVIIVIGFPPLWELLPGEFAVPIVAGLRGLRLFVLFGILVRLSRVSQKVLKKNRLGATLMVSVVVICLSGIAITMLDPAIQTVEEGIWWAWVTVTTVGYGDFVPSSLVGRIFGGLLILLGVGLFALLTANFSAILIGQEVTEMEREVSEVSAEENAIMETLERIEGRLTAIEAKLKKSEINNREE